MIANSANKGGLHRLLLGMMIVVIMAGCASYDDRGKSAAGSFSCALNARITEEDTPVNS